MASKWLSPLRSFLHSFLPRKRRIEDFYHVSTLLGSGNYSTVKLGIHKKTGEEVALKIIEKESLSELERENLTNETEILKNCCHPNIVTLKDVFEDRKRVVLVMELLKGGELLEAIRSKKTFPESEAKAIVRQIIEALAYLHSNGIIHRDVKPENVLFTTNFSEVCHLKLVDFGFARVVGEGFVHTPCGSAAYVAPEIVREEPYSVTVDMWSVGVILYILLCGFPPFYHEEAKKLFERIKKGVVEFPDPYWSRVSLPAKDLVRQLLASPSTRLSATAALQHPWLLLSRDSPLRSQNNSIRLSESVGHSLRSVDDSAFAAALGLSLASEGKRRKKREKRRRNKQEKRDEKEKESQEDNEDNNCHSKREEEDSKSPRESNESRRPAII